MAVNETEAPQCHKCGVLMTVVHMGHLSAGRADAYRCHNDRCSENGGARTRFSGQPPTHIGDVLIQQKASVGPIVVCPVSAEGQQHCTADYHIATSLNDALAKASALVVANGRVFVVHTEAGEWERFSTLPAS